MEDGLEQNRSILSIQEEKILETKISQLTLNNITNSIKSQNLKKSICEEPLSWSFKDSELAQSQR